MNTHKEVPEHLNICDLFQLIQPQTGYEKYPGYLKLLSEKDSEIRDKKTVGIYKTIINKKIDPTSTASNDY